MTHTETMASFTPDIKSRMNKKIFWDLKMAEKCLERLEFEPTTILDYSKLLSNFRGHFGGRGTMGQEAVELICKNARKTRQNETI